MAAIAHFLIIFLLVAVVLGILTLRRRTKILLIVLLCVMYLPMLGLWLGMKSRMNTPPDELFRRNILNPIPESVEIVGFDRSLGWQDPHYCLHFKMSSNDFSRVLASRPFVSALFESASPSHAERIVYLPNLFTNWLASSSWAIEDLELYEHERNGSIVTIWVTPEHSEVFYNSIVW